MKFVGSKDLKTTFRIGTVFKFKNQPIILHHSIIACLGTELFRHRPTDGQ